MKTNKNTTETYTINGIKCKVIHEKIKNTYIQIKEGTVIIKVPKSASITYIEKIVRDKEKWITKKLEEQNQKTIINYKDGDVVKVLGKPYTLKINCTQNRREHIYTEKDYIYCVLNNENFKNKPEESIKKLIDKYYKYIATQEIPSAMESLKNLTGLFPIECRIKKLKSAWGICSSNKKISINQNLMAYSRHAIEYVCLHEICHLKYMNHSKDFWNMVEHYMPDYKIAKQELKG